MKIDGDDNERHLGIDSVMAIPLEDWSIDLVTPQTVCVQQEGNCLPQNLPEFVDARCGSHSRNILPPFQKSRNASPQSTVARSLGSFLRMTTKRTVSTKGLLQVCSARAHGR